MNQADIAARIRRLERLSVGLAKEISIWQECNDPLLDVERREFLTAIRDAHSGIEGCKTTPSKRLLKLSQTTGLEVAAQTKAAEIMLADMVRNIELGKAGLINEFMQHRSKPITEHIDNYLTVDPLKLSRPAYLDGFALWITTII